MHVNVILSCVDISSPAVKQYGPVERMTSCDVTSSENTGNNVQTGNK